MSPHNRHDNRRAGRSQGLRQLHSWPSSTQRCTWCTSCKMVRSLPKQQRELVVKNQQSLCRGYYAPHVRTSWAEFVCFPDAIKVALAANENSTAGHGGCCTDSLTQIIADQE